MKYIYVLSLTLALGLVQAQNDTIAIEYGTESGPMDTFTFVDAREYVFMTQVPTRSLLKVPLLRYAPVERGFNSISPIDDSPLLAYEQKLGPAVSVNAAALLGSVSFGDDKPFTISSYGVSLEPRLFLGMRGRIARGESADNLSGNYLGLRLGFHRYRAFAQSETQPNLILGSAERFPDKSAASALLTFGIQRRLLRRGFFDINVGVGTGQIQQVDYAYDQEAGFWVGSLEEGWRPVFNVQAGIGLAFGEGRPEDGLLCDAMLCFREESRMFRIDLLNALQELNQRALSGVLTAAYEQKLGRSAFSMILEGEFSYGLTSFSGFDNRELIWRGTLEPRFYYNLRRRIAKGKSANNLSADFVSLRFSVGQRSYYEEAESRPEPLDFTYRQYLVMPTWGIQRRVFRRAFIGYQFGIGGGLETREDNTSFLFDSRSRLMMGLAF